jgi:hypothetical protein
MGKIFWTITALIVLGIFSPTAAPAAQTRLAQASEAPPPAPAPAESKEEQPPPPSAAKPAGRVKAAAKATGCALKFMAAEVAGKLKGRKWREFREQECAAGSNAQAVFPTAIAPKYSGQDPDKARMLTCADQFKANKATNGNGGMQWIESGGGYYSECVSRLKG